MTNKETALKPYTVGCRREYDDTIDFIKVEAINAFEARRLGKEKFIKEVLDGDVNGREVYTEFIFAGHINCIYNETGFGMLDKELKKL